MNVKHEHTERLNKLKFSYFVDRACRYDSC